MGNCFKKETASQSTTNASPLVSDSNYEASPIKESNNPVAVPELEISDTACFGAGCFWGTEKYFTVDFARRRYPESLIRGRVGV